MTPRALLSTWLLTLSVSTVLVVPEVRADVNPPTISGFSVNDTLLSEGDTGDKKFIVTIDFNEAMDTGVNPTLSFTPTVSSTLTLDSISWTDSDTVVVRYDVADGNITLSDVDITVSDAEDATSVEMASDTRTDEFSIDTVKPTISNFSVNDSFLTEENAGDQKFIVTIDFSETMDTGVNPSLVFSPSVSSTLTLDSTSWTDSDTVVIRYDVADANVDSENIDITVTLAEDSNGNVMASSAYADELSIDTLKPTITGLSADDTMLTESDVGDKEIIFTIDFSEAMDTGTNPGIAFSPTVASTLTFDSAEWTDSNTVLMKYDVADGDIDVDDVDLTVTLAADADGNVMASSGQADKFSVDTIQPTISSLSVNDSLLTEADLGDKKLIVTIDFSEAMDTGTNPSLSFTPSVSSTLTLDSTSWSDSDTVVVRYDVADANVDVDDVDITVTLAEDSNGNVMASSANADEFSIDTGQPTVSSVTPNISTVGEGNVGTDTFTLTVVFSEAMDTGVAPVVSFPTEDPSSTLTNGGGSWSNNTTYLMTYDVVDVDQTLANVDVQVASAQDSGGNTMAASTSADVFSIDTTKASISNLSVNDTYLTEADTGDKKLIVTIDFSETMNTGVNPTLSFTPTVSSTLTLDSTSWTDSDTVVVRYDVTDANVAVSDVDITVSNAEDSNENVMTSSVHADQFSIDTVKPTISSVSVDDATLTQADIGDQEFIVTINFSEDMNTGVNPGISFTPAVSSTLTFDSAEWTSSSAVLMKYDVSDGDVDIDNIDITVTLAQDSNNNVMASSGHADEFNVRTIQPSLTGSPFTPADGTIDLEPDVNFQFTVTEAVTKGTGFIRIRYVSSDVTQQTISVNHAGITITGGTTININPPSDLPQGQEMYFDIDGSAFLDSDGNEFDGISDKTVWNMTAAFVPDIIAYTSPQFESHDCPTSYITDETPYTLTLTFDEDINESTFTFDDIIVSGGSKSNFQTVTPGRAYSLVLTPESDHVLMSVTVNRRTLEDLDGFGNYGRTAYIRYTNGWALCPGAMHASDCSDARAAQRFNHHKIVLYDPSTGAPFASATFLKEEAPKDLSMVRWGVQTNSRKASYVHELSGKPGITGLCLMVLKDEAHNFFRYCSGRSSASCLATDSWHGLWWHEGTGLLRHLTENGWDEETMKQYRLELTQEVNSSCTLVDVWKICGPITSSAEAFYSPAYPVPDVGEWAMLAVFGACGFFLWRYRHLFNPTSHQDL